METHQNLSHSILIGDPFLCSSTHDDGLLTAAHILSRQDCSLKPERSSGKNKGHRPFCQIGSRSVSGQDRLNEGFKSRRLLFRRKQCQRLGYSVSTFHTRITIRLVLEIVHLMSQIILTWLQLYILDLADFKGREGSSKNGILIYLDIEKKPNPNFLIHLDPIGYIPVGTQNCLNVP